LLDVFSKTNLKLELSLDCHRLSSSVALEEALPPLSKPVSSLTPSSALGKPHKDSFSNHVLKNERLPSQRTSEAASNPCLIQFNGRHQRKEFAQRKRNFVAASTENRGMGVHVRCVGPPPASKSLPTVY